MDTRRNRGQGRLPTKEAELTTAEVAKRMGCREQRVRQLEASALRKLREAFPGLLELIQ